MSQIPQMTLQEYQRRKIGIDTVYFTNEQLRKIAELEGIILPLELQDFQVKEFMWIYYRFSVSKYFINLNVPINEGQLLIALLDVNNVFFNEEQLKTIANYHLINIELSKTYEELRNYLWIFHRKLIQMYLDREIKRMKLNNLLKQYYDRADWQNYHKTKLDLAEIPPFPQKIKQILPRPSHIQPKGKEPETQVKSKKRKLSEIKDSQAQEQVKQQKKARGSTSAKSTEEKKFEDYVKQQKDRYMSAVIKLKLHPIALTKLDNIYLLCIQPIFYWTRNLQILLNLEPRFNLNECFNNIIQWIESSYKQDAIKNFYKVMESLLQFQTQIKQIDIDYKNNDNITIIITKTAEIDRKVTELIASFQEFK